ncbi:MAG: signal peptide peptidase SppA [Vicingaceae bacterium]
MKDFFKFMFASMLGFLLTIGIATFIFFVTISAIIASAEDTKEPKIASNTILHIKFENAIQDRPSNNPFENIDFSTFEDKTPLSLKNILDNIEKAKVDDRIKGIYLDIPYLKANMATTEEIREALIDFKTSGKFIISYSENYGQGEYYLASVADEIYLNPAGEMNFKGYAATLLFFKDALNRLDVDMQVIRHGKFKSAIEPFIRNDMSAENRKQYEELIGSIWASRLEKIAGSRNLTVDKLNEIADSLTIRIAEDAKKNGLVDELLFEDEVKKRLVEKSEVESEDELNFLALKKFNKAKRKLKDGDDGDKEKWNSKNKVALIYAEGEIVSGESRDGSMGSETIAKAIKEARQDKKVKAIVLRVNSPGGSALASDVMWREVKLAKAEKPVVVSMGDVAASGGYYISCGANKIFAESSTITGSIGVFGLIPNMEGMLNNKLGIHTDRVTTNTYSDGLSSLRPLAKKERTALREMIEHIYDEFTQKVADGRNMTQAEVDSIGQGRVWSGLSALKIGLVDEIGGLDNAILAAVEMAELEDYKLKELPAREDPIQKMMSEFAAEARMSIAGEAFGPAAKYYSNAKRVFESNGIYTRLPVDIIVE